MKDSYISWKKWNSFGFLTPERYRYFEEVFRKNNIKPNAGSRLLEIGFGNGEFLAFASKKHWNIKGTEINNNLISAAKKQNFNVYPPNQISKNHNGCFDYIFAFDVLEHISDSRLLRFFVTVNKMLKRNGVFIARFPNGDSPFGLILQNGDITHKSAIGSSKIEYLCTNANLILTFLGPEVLYHEKKTKINTLLFFLINCIKSFCNLIAKKIICPNNNNFYLFEKNLFIMCKKK